MEVSCYIRINSPGLLYPSLCPVAAVDDFRVRFSFVNYKHIILFIIEQDTNLFVEIRVNLLGRIE